MVGGVLATVMILIGAAFVAGKMRPIAAPIISATESTRNGSSEIELAILIPQRCEEGELSVRYVERNSGIAVKSQYRRKSILPPEFSCTLMLLEFGYVVKVVISRIERESGSRPKSIADLSQPVARPVVYVDQFRADFEAPYGPGLDVKVQRVESLD